MKEKASFHFFVPFVMKGIQYIKDAEGDNQYAVIDLNVWGELFLHLIEEAQDTIAFDQHIAMKNVEKAAQEKVNPLAKLKANKNHKTFVEMPSVKAVIPAPIVQKEVPKPSETPHKNGKAKEGDMYFKTTG